MGGLGLFPGCDFPLLFVFSISVGRSFGSVFLVFPDGFRWDFLITRLRFGASFCGFGWFGVRSIQDIGHFSPHSFVFRCGCGWLWLFLGGSFVTRCSFFGDWVVLWGFLEGIGGLWRKVF